MVAAKQYKYTYDDMAIRSVPVRLIGDARAEIALNILGFLIGLYYAAIIKTRCPPASEFRNSETRLSLAMAGRPLVFCIM